MVWECRGTTASQAYSEEGAGQKFPGLGLQLNGAFPLSMSGGDIRLCQLRRQTRSRATPRLPPLPDQADDRRVGTRAEAISRGVGRFEVCSDWRVRFSGEGMGGLGRTVSVTGRGDFEATGGAY